MFKAFVAEQSKKALLVLRNKAKRLYLIPILMISFSIGYGVGASGRYPLVEPVVVTPNKPVEVIAPVPVTSVPVKVETLFDKLENNK